ncbi:MAG: hypothetical protein AAF304_08560 [Pseudomonadota bacterium]
MPARFILHIVLTLVLIAIGWWLYMQLGGGQYDSMSVATYWFTALVFILLSWLFYWFVHRLKTKAWIIALIIAGVLTAVSTTTLLFLSKQNQEMLEKEALAQELEDSQENETQDLEASSELETLNLGEDLEEGTE